MSEPIKPEEFWAWFADALQTVAGKAYRRGWQDSSFSEEVLRTHPEATHAPFEVQQGWYVDSGFEPEFVATLYHPPFSISAFLPPEGK